MRLEGRQHAGNLLEADAVGPLVRPGVRRHFDTAARHHVGNDLGDLAHAIIVAGVAHVERLVEHHLFGRIERGNERAGDILDMRDRPPGRSIRLEVDDAAGDGKGRQIVEDDVEAHARRHAIGGRRPQIDRAEPIAGQAA